MHDERPAGGGILRRWSDVTPTPWRNGGGVTRELASSPTGGDFDWRISIAEVTAPGEFSVFAGVWRTIVLLDGPAMTLTVGGAPHRLVRHRPFGFDGGENVSCAVSAGPTRDLNVMTRVGRCRATVDVRELDPAQPADAPGRPLQLVIPLTDGLVVTGPGDHRVTLGRYDLSRLPPDTTVSLAGDGPVAVIEIVRES